MIDFEEINIAALIGGILAGIFSVYIASTMMPSILIEIMAFFISLVVGYIVTDKILSK